MSKEMKRLKINKKILYSLSIYMLMTMLMQIIPYSDSLNKIIGIFAIVFSAVWIYKCWNNTYMLFISAFIGYCNYSIIVGVYLDTSLRDNTYLYNQINDVNVYGLGVWILMSFVFFLAIFSPKMSKKENSIYQWFNQKKKNSIILFIVGLIGFIFCLLKGYTFGNGGRGDSSPLYEYGVIFLLIMLFYSERKKIRLLVCAFMTFSYCLISFFNGSRIEALICIVIFVICYFQNNIKRSYFFAGMVIGIVLFSSIGVIRGNWLVLVSEGPMTIITKIVQNKFVFDTCTHAYFPMLCMIEKFRQCSIIDSLYYLFKFSLSIILGQSRVLDGDLISIVKNFYYHNNGGVTLGFFYVWFKILGPFIMALYVNYWQKVIVRANSKHKYIYPLTIYFAATTPRWYLYGPWSFTRGIVFCLIAFTAFEKFRQLLSSGNKVYRNIETR